MSTNNQHPVHKANVVRYVLSDRNEVQGFADVEVDDTWRFNGVNLLRSGDILPGQLTPVIDGRRVSIASVQILDPVLCEGVVAAIRSALLEYLAALPPDERSKPPRPLEPRKPEERPAKTVARPQDAPAPARPARIILPARPIGPRRPLAGAKSPADKPKLRPPDRLLANHVRRFE